MKQESRKAQVSRNPKGRPEQSSSATARLPDKPEAAEPEADLAGPEDHTTRKQRSVWFYERTTFPLRDAPPERLENFWRGALRPAKSGARGRATAFGGARWEEMGPFNIAGRTTSLALDRSENPVVIYAGTAGGGVWRRAYTEDRWKPIWPRTYSHNIGAIGLLHDLKTRVELIVATGEANLSSDTYPGTGIYISSDAGESWKPFLRRSDGSALDKVGRSGVPRRVGSIQFDPHRKLVGALGSVSHDERLVSGLYLMGPKGFQASHCWGMRSYNCHCVLFDPQTPGRLYAALDLRGSGSGVWVSDNSGEDWRQLTEGLPTGDQFGRISLAMAPSNPEVMYLLASDRRRFLLGVFRSRDAGKKWEQIAASDTRIAGTDGEAKDFSDERFLSYNNTITVHPENPDFVIWGGVHLYRQEEKNGWWKQVTTLERFLDGFARRKPNPAYCHEDHHALLMPKGDIILSGNDGGVAVSIDGGDTWRDWSEGLATTMFYDVDVAPSNGEVMGGGAQDNGTLITGVKKRGCIKLKKGEFLQGFPGDGGWIVFDPEDEEAVFGSYQEFNILRHKRDLPWDVWLVAGPRPGQMADLERKQRAIIVLEIEPGRVIGRKRRVWGGTSRLWMTADGGKTWKARETAFDGSVISAIHVASADPKVMFVGTTKGGIFRSLDGGKTWSEDLGGPEIPRRMVSRIETHPRNAYEVVATVASTGVPGAQLLERIPNQKGLQASVRTKFQKVYSNVFQSADMGSTWKDIDLGNLPNVVFNAVAYDTCRPGLIYVGGDVGVWVRFNGDWHSLTANLPNVVVSDLVFHDKDRTLTAATYGRGIWRLPTAELTFDGHVSECDEK